MKMKIPQSVRTRRSLEMKASSLEPHLLLKVTNIPRIDDPITEPNF